MERGSCDISNNIRIFCQVPSRKQIRIRSYGSKLQHFLLHVTEDGFDHGEENWGHFDVWTTKFPWHSFTYVIGTSSTSQLILQPFRRFAYLTAHSATLPLLHLRHRCFSYVTAHSTTHPPLHLRHSSFYNSSATPPTSQALHLLHLASRPCIGGWKTSL